MAQAESESCNRLFGKNFSGQLVLEFLDACCSRCHDTEERTYFEVNWSRFNLSLFQLLAAHKLRPRLEIIKRLICDF